MRASGLGQTGGVKYGVVEGEPGIFPDPVARLMRAIGGLFSRRERQGQDERPPQDQQQSDPPGDDTGPGKPAAPT